MVSLFTKITVTGKHLPVAHPLIFPIVFLIVALLTFINLLIFFLLFSKRRFNAQYPFPINKMPFFCGPRLFRYMYVEMNPLLEVMLPAIVNLQSKRKGS